jgi:deltex-like protein
LAVSTAEIAQMRKDRHPADGDDDEQLACSICLGDMNSDDGDASPSVVRLVDCLHMFHEDCIELAFKTKAQCPLCMRWYSAAVGNQPLGSTMTVRVVPGMVPGHPDANSYHEITYHVPSGKQTEQHPRPGRHYTGTTRVAYLPNNREGSLVLKLLQLAFSQRLIFTVGDSVTSGAQNVAIWNGIHHKTNLHGGSQYYGYPDDSYLERVQEELASMGIRKEMLDE